MSVLLAVVSAVQSVAPSVSPSVAPVVHTVAVTHVNTIGDALNALAGKVSQADLLVAAGIIATGVQYLINRFANVRKFTNQLLGLAIPFLVAAPTVINGFKAEYGVAIYAIAQLLYYLVEKLKDSVKPAPVQL